MSDDTSNRIDFVVTDANDIYTEIIQALESHVDEPLFPGDERRIYGEALVQVFVSLHNKLNDTAKQSLLKYARGNVLDAIGERSGTLRMEGNKATTIMQFSISNIISTNVIIPAETRVTPDGKMYFVTTSVAVIQSGALSVEVEAVAAESGVLYNGYPPASIDTLVDLIPYISNVVNLTETSGGDDGEPYDIIGDDHYRERIRLAPGKRSTAGPGIAYEYWAMTADASISDVYASTPEPGVVVVVPLLSGGEIPDDAMLKKVLDVVSRDDIRPLGDRVKAQAPTVTEFDIRLKYYVTSATASEVVENVEGNNGAIERYIEWQAEALGRDINPDYLRRLILAPDWQDGLTGAVRVDLQSPGFAKIGPTEVAKWSGVLEVSHDAVEGGS